MIALGEKYIDNVSVGSEPASTVLISNEDVYSTPEYLKAFKNVEVITKSLINSLNINGNNISKIIIPRNVISVEKSAFSSFTNVDELCVSTHIDLRNSGMIFNKNKPLNVHYYVGNSTEVNQMLESYGSGLDKTGLTINLYFQNGITSLKQNAFYNCNFGTIMIPNSLINFGYDSLVGDATNMYVPNVNWVLTKAYYGALKIDNLFINEVLITTLTIPEGTTQLSDKILRGLVGITNINIPDSVTSISYGVFIDCKNLKTITFPSTIESISTDDLFRGCEKLTNIYNLPQYGYAQNRLFSGCFTDCKSLKSLVIPAGITTIDTGAIGRCTALESLSVDSNNPVYSSPLNSNVVIEGTKLIASCKTSVIPNEVDEYGRGSFYKREDLVSLSVPNTITKIGTSAFSYCINLESIYLPNSIVSGDTSRNGTPTPIRFSYCSKLTNIILENDFNYPLNLRQQSLSAQTIVGIISSLKDLSGLESKTMEFGSSNLSQLTEEQIAVATNKNWTLA